MVLQRVGFVERNMRFRHAHAHNEQLFRHLQLGVGHGRHLRLSSN